MKPNIKKLLILNAPYLLFVYLFDKVGQAVRLSPGADLSGKLLSIGSGFSAAFSNALPSFNPMDLLIGIVGAVLIRLIVYVKGKNAKKYRKGIEYGSARWGNAEDIKPYTDPVFQNNVLLTQTERLTMNSRPKQPKYARNKNIVVIGGSGSGKTRFFVKPSVMQMNCSMVITDPKGTLIEECGKMLAKGPPKRDKDGNVIVTRLNEQMCQEIAKAGNGMYIRVDNTNSAEKVLNNEIAKLSKADVESQVYTEFDEQFQALAWLVLILLVVEMLILERKNPLFKNVRLFK